MYGLIKKLYGGRISFNDPYLKPAFAILDAADAAARLVSGLKGLPPYSVRVRTNGVQGEFGGRKFIESGQRLLERLPPELNVRTSKILDIGCSCGRLAYAVRKLGFSGSYVGLDIDASTIKWATKHIEKHDQKYHFVLAEVFSDVYNQTSRTQASEYEFPFTANAFDLIFAYSLFTHLLDAELENYFGNAGRCIKDDGVFVFSCFVMDEAASGSFMSQASLRGKTHLYSESSPRKATAFAEPYLREALSAAGFRNVLMLPGVWRKSNSLGGSDQDLFICRKGGGRSGNH
jgi:SAM-dependent methyltransferase